MCRYAYKDYKPHYVCFACRKQFKRPPLDDVAAQHGRLEPLRELNRAYYDETLRQEVERRTGTTVEAINAWYRALVSTCPQCGGSMEHLGLDFKPPPASATRVWERIHAAHRLGHRWQTCGCDGPGFVPRTRRDLIDYLRARRQSEAGPWTRRSKQLAAEAARIGYRL